MTSTRTTLPLSIRTRGNGRRFIVELDADRMERLAAGLGLFRNEFLESLKRAEREVAGGNVKRLQSLRSLRKS